jgi:nucleoside 2-deoxyribosyltransferase
VDEVWEDPEYEAWAQHVRDAVVPVMERAAVAITLIPAARSDVRFAVELGLSIMLDKPIIALVQPGMRIPNALAAVAAEIVEVDISRDPDGAQRSIADAFARVMHTGDRHISLEDSDE